MVGQKVKRDALQCSRMMLPKLGVCTTVCVATDNISCCDCTAVLLWWLAGVTSKPPSVPYVVVNRNWPPAGRRVQPIEAGTTRKCMVWQYNAHGSLLTSAAAAAGGRAIAVRAARHFCAGGDPCGSYPPAANSCALLAIPAAVLHHHHNC